jgi:hypothetical protein
MSWIHLAAHIKGQSHTVMISGSRKWFQFLDKFIKERLCSLVLVN